MDLQCIGLQWQVGISLLSWNRAKFRSNVICIKNLPYSFTPSESLERMDFHLRHSTRLLG